MNLATVLSIGDEIVDGRTLDTNARWLAARLAELGFEVTAHVAEGDAVADIRSGLDYAAGRGRVVVVTGGLGPTEDDRTREAVAAWAGVGLVEHGPSWDEIQAWFARLGRMPSEANRRQALLPEGARPLPNAVGTAPGFALAARGVEVFVLPGVPAEMERMFEDRVRPDLAARGRPLVQRTLAFAGVAESLLGELFADHMREGRPIRVGMTAHEGLIRVTARGAGDGAEAAIDELFAELARKGRRWVVGEGRGGLEDFVVGRLHRHGLRLALAESCTAGLVAARVGRVPGASEVFVAGLVTYANEAKQALLGVPAEVLAEHGAVSEACARARAAGARRASGADLAAAVTGIAGPGGGSADKPVGLVHFAVDGPRGGAVLERRYGDLGRELLRQRAATECLLLLLRALRELDGPEGSGA
ncbi:MAG: CinA family nicotinamide mononucleotide deamidase-related protein [Planctomycetota bacterium]